MSHDPPDDVPADPVDGLIERWLRPELRALRAYHVPPADGLVKLDAMENPYGWPEALLEPWLERLRRVELNRYPDAGAQVLKAALRAHMGLDAAAGDVGLVLGNGSDELIQLLILAVGGPGRTVLAPEPTFVMYRLLAQLTGTRFEGVPLRAADFALDGPALLAAVERLQPALVFLACPNNPTGNLFAPEVVRAVLERSPGLVVLDEAYHPFAQTTWLGELARHPGLLVMRTLSKLGLAGLRIGMLAGEARLTAELEKLRLPYNLNVLSQVSAVFALEHMAVLDEQAARIREAREGLFGALGALPGVEVWPSRANFLLFRVPGDAVAVFEGLKARGVLVRCLHGAHPLLERCLRVSVGRPGENALFLEALGAELSLR